MDWKKIGLALLYPPVWLIILLTALSTVLLTEVFMSGSDASPIAYAIYTLAFYTLAVICTALVRYVPVLFKSTKEKVLDTKYGGRYFTDVVFKTNISLYFSFSINLLNAAINLLSGLLYGTLWSMILAVYYLLLALMRFLLLRYFRCNGIRNELIREYRRSRLCGVILMNVNLALFVVVLMMLYQNRGYEYNGILIYVMALYTFYVTVHSITNIVKYRKYNSPVMSSAMIINFSAALVSMLSLETAMLSQFGGNMQPNSKLLMIGVTGAGVIIIVLAMSIHMIARANIEIRKLSMSAL